MIYDIPMRTGRKVAHRHADPSWPARCRTSSASKDAGRQSRRDGGADRRRAGGFEVYSGDDTMTLPLLAVGAVGVVGVATHWAGAATSEMIAPVRQGRRRRRPAVNARLLESFAFETGDDAPNPMPDQGDDARARAARRPVPPADGPRARLASRTGPARCWPNLDAAAASRARWPSPVRVAFLGGLGEIGRNCIVVEQDGRLLLIDCGLMFPDADMHGIDLVLPDFTWLRENADRIVGCVATHGHEDHVGGLPFLLRDLLFPIYGSAVTLGLARNRIEEAGLLGRTELITGRDGERGGSGRSTSSSSPSPTPCRTRFAIALHTPQGVILHSGDFKLDLTPVDGRRTDLARIGAIAASDGIRLLLGDSTNAEEPGHTPSETTVGGGAAQLFARARAAGGSSRPASPATSTASSRSPTRRSPPAASSPRSGCSMKKNVRLARDLGRAAHPRRLAGRHRGDRPLPARRGVRDLDRSAGRADVGAGAAGRGREQWLKVGEHDTVILVQPRHPRQRVQRQPGDRRPAPAGAEVVHSGIADVHATGHAQAGRAEDAAVDRPARVLHAGARRVPPPASPTPGWRRQMGVRARPRRCCARTATCSSSATTGVEFAGRVPAGYLYVDGIVGDVGQGVLRDRRVLAEEGVVVVVVTVDVAAGEVLTGPEIITRGWVYAPEAEDLLDEGADAVARGGREGGRRGTGTRRRHARDGRASRRRADSSTSAPGAGR